MKLIKSMNKPFILSIIFFISISNLDAHPLKMSFNKLEIAWDGSVKIESRIFLDDLTAQLKSLYNLDQINFADANSQSTIALQQYINKNFYFEQNGQKIPLIIDDITFATMKLAIVLNLTTFDKLINSADPFDNSGDIFLVNKILFDADPKQKNDILYLNEHHLLNVVNTKLKIRFD